MIQHYSQWDRIYRSAKDFMLITNNSLSFILREARIVKKEYAIDLGCGTGQLSRELYHRGFQKITGVDISKVGVKLAQEATTFPDLEYFTFNLEEDFETLFSKKADLVTTKYTFAFIEDKPRFIARCLSLLSPNAPFIIISPAAKYLAKEKKHISVDPQLTKALLEKYFNTVNYFEHARDDIFICRK